MIFSAFERLVAFRYLRARRQEGFISVISWFSLLGIGLGVATLIVVMSVMNGFRIELFDRVLGLNGHMNVFSRAGGYLYNYEDALQAVSAVKGVREVSPILEGQSLITHNGAASGTMIRGVLPDVFAKQAIIRSHIVEGRLEDMGEDKIVIGYRMAQRLMLSVGDKLTLISPTSNNTVFGSAPRMRAFEIAAIFNVGMYEYDNGFIFMPLDLAENFFRTNGGVSSLEIFVENPVRLADIKFEAIAALRDQPVRLLDWQQSNSSFYSAIEVERNVMFLILSLMIMIAAFNIISGLFMLVKDKGRDIAILRTMGATRGSVMRIFVLAGASIGVAGTLLGLGLGVCVAHNIEEVRQALQALTRTSLFPAEVYFLTHMPSVIDWHEVAEIAAMSLGLSFLATLYPSWRAARLDPIEALRYE